MAMNIQSLTLKHQDEDINLSLEEQSAMKFEKHRTPGKKELKKKKGPTHLRPGHIKVPKVNK